MNREDRSVADAVGKVIAEIACAVDRIVDAFDKSGRLIYLGAGTSGRLGVLDAAECPATFSVPADMVLGLIAGGADAFSKATESAEDDAEAGVEALKDIGLIRRDVVVGITVQRSYSVCGRRPGLMPKLWAQSTVALSCNQDAAIAARGRHFDPAGRRAGGSGRLDPPQVWHGAEALCAQHAHYRKRMIRLGQVLPEPDGRSQTDQHESLRRPGHGAAIVTQAMGCTTEQAQEVLRLTGNDGQACDPDYGYGHAS